MPDESKIVACIVREGGIVPVDETVVGKLLDGAEFSIEIPAKVLMHEPVAEEEPVLVEKDSFLFLRLVNHTAGEQEEMESNRILKQCSVTPKDGAYYAPIRLLEDLRIRRVSRTLKPCRCVVLGGIEVRSLNEGCKMLKSQFTQTQGATNVFDGVSFVRKHSLLKLDRMRSLVIDGIELPSSEPDNQIDLFDGHESEAP